MDYGNIRVCGPQHDILDSDVTDAKHAYLYYSNDPDHLAKLREIRPVLSITQQPLTILVYPKNVKVPKEELGGLNVAEILYFEDFVGATRHVRERYYKQPDKANDKLRKHYNKRNKRDVENTNKNICTRNLKFWIFDLCVFIDDG